jgi:hypothetical protein
VIAIYVLLALIVVLGGAMCYVACWIGCEERKAGGLGTHRRGHGKGE